MKATDWDQYYKQPAFAARLTRPITYAAVLRAIRTHGSPSPTIVELGGGGSRIYDVIRDAVHPSEYHIVDTNGYGLSLVRERSGSNAIRTHQCDVRTVDLGKLVDVVFSLGLIEHFDPSGTREAIRAHLRLLKSGGVAIITFPTPTLMYRAARSFLELVGQWIFHDERPLWVDEIKRAIEPEGKLVHEVLIWKILLTQRLVVIQKR